EAQHSAPEAPVADVVASVSFTAFGNVTGLPAISLPLHWTESELPVGVQLVGGPWQEALLIRLSAQLEEARPWAHRRAALAGIAEVGSEQIPTEVAERVLTITLNRPERLNAWTATMSRELIEAFDHADGDDEVGAIIVTGAGRGFCAGADLAAGGETFDW